MAEAPLAITVQLKVALEHGGDIIEELTLTEPTLGGMMEMDKATGEMGQTMAAIIACTQLPPSVVKQLRMRDLKAVGEAAKAIMGESQETTGMPARGSRIRSISSPPKLNA